jgi:hypothetical protein
MRSHARRFDSFASLVLAATALIAACGGAGKQTQSQSPAAEGRTEAQVAGHAGAPEADETADTDPSALPQFQKPLEPYGTWVDDPTYGTVWVPNAEAVGPDFAPYETAGHWALTEDDQWTWVSDYPWGWAPFHYGRWLWIDGRGWAWIPGGVYAPAWVVWRTGVYDEAYVGWAPMPPVWCWRGGVAVRVSVGAPSRDVFVPSR